MPSTQKSAGLRFRKRSLALFGAVLCFSPLLHAASEISGKVVDTNGRPIAQAQVIFDREEPAQGASVVTVFTDAGGNFHFPGSFAEDVTTTSDIRVRALGYRQVDRALHPERLAAEKSTVAIHFVMAATTNQVDVAPASAWLQQRIPDRAQQSQFIMDCIDCHQVPAPEVRNYAASIADLHAADPAQARLDSWNTIVKYMNYLSAWEFSRGRRNADEKLDTDAVYAVENGTAVAAQLGNIFDDRLDDIEGFDWGAPVIATANTRIWEYEFDHPNAVREALLLGDPQQLWVADVSANHLFTVDIVTGKRDTQEVPSEVLMSPHSMHRGKDGSLWVTPLFNSIVARRDMESGEWQTWRLRTGDGKSPGIHDLSFGYEHELLTDGENRIWFSDIGNNSVGYFDPEDGSSEIWRAPPSPGREGPTSLYGLIMTKDHKEVWYSQLANGTFGGFDIEKKEYIGPFQLPDANAGPRRITISDDDVIYLALYGSGQLAEFDAKTRKMIGIYDLPDTASAPYSATWDPVRKVVWVPTSNGDVIYRFNPGDKSFGVLPLPRAQTFLRMVDIDPETGVLISSYGNIVDIVQGPRMALLIDPGDGAYPKPFKLDGSGLRQ